MTIKTIGVAILEECESIGNRTTCFDEEVALPLYTNTVTFVLSKEVDNCAGSGRCAGVQQCEVEVVARACTSVCYRHTIASGRRHRRRDVTRPRGGRPRDRC